MSAGTKKAAIRRIDVGDERGGPLVALDGGLLLPLASGQIMVLDATTGGKRAEAFQPKLAPGDVWQWQVSPPAGKLVLVHGSCQSRSLHASKPASDESHAMPASRLTGPAGGIDAGRSKLYLLGLKTEPRPHLAAVAQVDLESPLVSRLAVAGQTGYAVEASGKLRAFSLPALTQGKSWPLAGRCAWGPATVGQHVFLAAGGKLLCLDGQQNLVWQVDLPHGPLAGAPAAVKDDYLFASTLGVVWRAEGASGKPLAKRETGRPLASGPLVVGNRVVLSGHDGTLYEVEQP